MAEKQTQDSSSDEVTKAATPPTEPAPPPKHEDTLGSLHGATPPADDEHQEGDVYGDNGLTLAQASAMSDEDLLAQPGIGPAKLKTIRKAQKKAGKQ